MENVKLDYMAAIRCPRFRNIQQAGKDGSIVNLNLSVHPDAIYIPGVMMKFNECSIGISNSVGNLGVKGTTRVDFTSVRRIM